MACPMLKATKEVTRPITRTTAVNTAALAARTSRRCGVAAMVARI